MNRLLNWKTSAALCAALALVACQSDRESASAPAGKSAAKPVAAMQKPGQKQSLSPGKITAPISIDYAIIGTPIIGQAVSINLQITSPLHDRTITVNYRVNEPGSLLFPESQVENVALLPAADATLRSQQVTVVPQREGRLYLVVSAEIETDDGTMMRSMSIPIQVGRAPREASLNGVLVEGVNTEAGISMPAKEP